MDSTESSSSRPSFPRSSPARPSTNSVPISLARFLNSRSNSDLGTLYVYPGAFAPRSRKVKCNRAPPPWKNDAPGFLTEISATRSSIPSRLSTGTTDGINDSPTSSSGRLSSSKTTTRSPRSTSMHASAQPAGPAPTITTVCRVPPISYTRFIFPLAVSAIAFTISILIGTL